MVTLEGSKEFPIRIAKAMQHVDPAEMACVIRLCRRTIHLQLLQAVIENGGLQRLKHDAGSAVSCIQRAIPAASITVTPHKVTANIPASECGDLIDLVRKQKIIILPEEDSQLVDPQSIKKQPDASATGTTQEKVGLKRSYTEKQVPQVKKRKVESSLRKTKSSTIADLEGEYRSLTVPSKTPSKKDTRPRVRRD